MSTNKKNAAKLEKQAAQLGKKVLAASKESHERGVAELDKIIQKYGDDANLINRLGTVCMRWDNLDLALRCFQYAVSKVPEHYSALNHLGLVLSGLGLGQHAANAYRQSLHYAPAFLPSLINIALSLLYFGKTGRHEILQAQKDIAAKAFSVTTDYLEDAGVEDLSTSRCLRVGFVSSDLREHAVGHFMRGILTGLDREKFEVHVFDNHDDKTDPWTVALRSLDISWHGISGMPTGGVCKKIVRAKIDILIDLNGHTAGCRQDVFCNRVAPVQAIYLGYPGSSGIPNMDYRIGDEFCDPEEFDSQNTEEVIRLPLAMWNYQPWSTMPDNFSQDPAFERNGYITFGSLNNHAKLQPEWLSLWARVLDRVPNSRLVIKSKAMKNMEVANRIRQIFGASFSEGRVELKHYSPSVEEHWNEVGDCDIGLDSFPYNGTTTTCDLLWMGVPVVSCAGGSHVSRTTGSILNALDMDDWLAWGEEEFVDLCVKKANELEALGSLKRSLRSRMKESSLINPELFVPEFEKALHSMWESSGFGKLTR